MEDIRFVQSDTAAVPTGRRDGRIPVAAGRRERGADGDRSGPGPRPRQLAAAELEASPDDIVVHDDGRVGVAGVPASALTWAALAGLAARPASGAGEAPARAASRLAGLMAAVDFTSRGATFPFGAHVSVVEVDIETGQVRPLRHIAVDDCGRDPQSAARDRPAARRHRPGHGAGPVGAGRLRRRTATRLTSNLADYAMPQRGGVPVFETANTETPTPRNPLGRQGHRRVRDDRLDPVRAQRRRRRRVPPRRPPHRHAVHARAGVAGHRGSRRGGGRRRPAAVARTRRPCSIDCRRPGAAARPEAADADI